MRISETGINLIKHFEGFSAQPYRCPAGYLTIGYGHVIGHGERFNSVDADRAEALLRADLASAQAAVGRLISVPLTQYRFDALVSFTFNLGAGLLQRSTLRRKINRGDYQSVPAQLLRFVWGGGHKLPGLVARRAAEARLYQGFPPFA